MNATKTVSLAEIRTAVLDCYIASLERGDGWWCVRVNIDGEIHRFIEASPCYSESEYYDRRPHTVTIYEIRGNGDLNEQEIETCRDEADNDWFEKVIPTIDLRAILETKAGLDLDIDC